MNTDLVVTTFIGRDLVASDLYDIGRVLRGSPGAPRLKELSEEARCFINQRNALSTDASVRFALVAIVFP